VQPPRLRILAAVERHVAEEVQGGGFAEGAARLAGGGERVGEERGRAVVVAESPGVAARDDQVAELLG
jgi:hypothetical protein